ncbi:hypothetical protein ACDJ30_002808 [Salmonella enterica]|nr:hypothetical protein [Salmonella enterica subsp. enterica]ECF6948260.1 hypothetical protein [Salmonella enterica subsp. diarizonae]
MNTVNKNDYTPADEKALASMFVWMATIRTLELQGSIDCEKLKNEIIGAQNRLTEVGETGASGYVNGYLELLNVNIELSRKNKKV